MQCWMKMSEQELTPGQIWTILHNLDLVLVFFNRILSFVRVVLKSDIFESLVTCESFHELHLSLQSKVLIVVTAMLITRFLLTNKLQAEKMLRRQRPLQPEHSTSVRWINPEELDLKENWHGSVPRLIGACSCISAFFWCKTQSTQPWPPAGWTGPQGR